MEQRERERVRKEQEKEAKKRAEDESKKKAKFWKIVMIIGVLLFVGGIYGCGESEWSWLWMSLIGAITAFVGFVAYEFFD